MALRSLSKAIKQIPCRKQFSTGRQRPEIRDRSREIPRISLLSAHTCCILSPQRFAFISPALFFTESLSRHIHTGLPLISFLNFVCRSSRTPSLFSCTLIWYLSDSFPADPLSAQIFCLFIAFLCIRIYPLHFLNIPFRFLSAHVSQHPAQRIRSIMK